jgi:hypothetical protein
MKSSQQDKLAKLMSNGKPRAYLGDSVYVSFDGQMITLTTNNGGEDSNTIHLELEVYAALLRFVALIAGTIRDDSTDNPA